MTTIPRLCAGLLLALAPLAATPRAIAQTADDLAEAGQQAMAAGRFPEAQASFEKLAALEPGIAEVHATLAVIDYKLRAYDKAAKEARAAQRIKPSLPGIDSLLGQSLAELGQFKEALPGLEKGFKQTADPEIRRMCGLELLRAYTNLSRDSDAVQTALALNKFYPNDPEILYNTGRIYGNIAYVVMERLHDQGPGSIWMLQAQGEANESEKNYDAAIVAFNHVLTIDPTRPGIHYRLGRVYLKRFRDAQKPEDRDAAAHEFQSELAINPGNGNALYELAVMAGDQGNPDEARKYYEQVVTRFPDYEEALTGLGGLLLESQSAKEALPLLEHASQIRPDDQVAWYRLAMAQRSLGNREAAQTAMTKYRQLHEADRSLGLRKPSEEEVTPQKVTPEAQP